jgi:diguanylate cyclase (GGDEF)-like protein
MKYHYSTLSIPRNDVSHPPPTTTQRAASHPSPPHFMTFPFGSVRHCTWPLLLAWLVLVSPLPAAARADAPVKTSVQLNWKHQFEFAAFYAALEQGYYREAGLDVTIKEGGPGVDSVREVAAGHADFGVATSSLVVARSRGIQVVALAALMQHSPVALLARRDAGIDSVLDLADRPVAVDPHDRDEIEAYLLASGIPRQRIRLIDQTDPTLAPLDEGRIAAKVIYVSNEPFLIRGKEHEYLMLTPKSAGIDLFGNILFTMSRTLNARPALVKAFREATLKGLVYSLDHPERIADLILKKYDTQNKSRAHLLYEAEHIRELTRPDIVEPGYMSPGRWRHVVDVYASQGTMPRNFDLTGFLYDPTPPRTPGWVAWSIAGLLLGLAASVTILLKVRGLNRKLKREISDRTQAEETIRTLAYFDPLTQLPNRLLLRDRLHQALALSRRSGLYGALLFIDLDNFKLLNDSHGHDTGDLMLKEVARRLQSCIREGDSVARLGGDEFVVLIEELDASQEEAASRAEIATEKIIDRLGRAYSLGKVDYHSTASIGITLFPDGDITVDDMLKRADLAMYQAKSAGRNTLRFFDPAMQAAIEARTMMEAEMRRAVTRGEFLFHYQPQVDNHGRMTGVEALARWPHAERGMIPPASFIPLAEETGLIMAIGEQLLRQACEQLRRWADDPATAHLSISMNVSARQFHDPDFVTVVLANLTAAGADPAKLTLEITESLLLENIDETIAKMEALKAHGIRFSIDDFGTGYSSLAYLKRLPLDELKIDRSFVADIEMDENDAAICTTFISLARLLDLRVVAEGVETDAQRYFLGIVHKCDAMQGYLLGKPVPSEQIPHDRNAAPD